MKYFGSEALTKLLGLIRQALKGKQDTITGAPGQVVQIGEDGKPAPADAYSKAEIDEKIAETTPHKWSVAIAPTNWTATSDTWSGIEAKYRATKPCEGMTVDTDVTSIQFAGGDRNSAASWAYLRPGVDICSFFSVDKPTEAFSLDVIAENINPSNVSEAYNKGDVYTAKRMITNGVVGLSGSKLVLYFPINVGKPLAVSMPPKFTALTGAIYGVTGGIDGSKLTGSAIDLGTSSYTNRCAIVDRTTGDLQGIVFGDFVGEDGNPVPANTPVTCEFNTLEITFQ